MPRAELAELYRLFGQVDSRHTLLCMFWWFKHLSSQLSILHCSLQTAPFFPFAIGWCREPNHLQQQADVLDSRDSLFTR